MAPRTPLLGVLLAAVLLASACGAAPSRSGTAARGPKATAAHPWPGILAWAALAKLGNYAYRATVVTTVGGRRSAVTVRARYHGPGDWELVLSPQDSPPVRLIQADNGHQYIVQAGQGPALDLGSAGKSPYSAMFRAYEYEATGPWTGLFSSSRGAYAGPCSVLGRAGSAYRVGGSTGGMGAAATGVEEAVGGSACIDARTGAPLRGRFRFRLAAGAEGMTYVDRMRVTAWGTVPEIPAPAGAAPLAGGGAGTR